MGVKRDSVKRDRVKRDRVVTRVLPQSVENGDEEGVRVGAWWVGGLWGGGGGSSSVTLHALNRRFLGC